jgi:hypothetical protein
MIRQTIGDGAYRSLGVRQSDYSGVRRVICRSSRFGWLFHSLVDYPERSMSLAVVTGMLAGLLGVPGRRAVDGRAGSEGVSE